MIRTMLAALLLTTAAQAASPYDGVYRGDYVNAGGSSPRCQPGSSMRITVENGRFDWRFGGQAAAVTVNPDGSFQGQNGARFVTGRVADGKVTATTTGPGCNYAWSLSR